MGRNKIDNPLNDRIMIRMDIKLREQLERQSGGKGKVSKTARLAIIKYLKENK